MSLKALVVCLSCTVHAFVSPKFASLPRPDTTTTKNPSRQQPPPSHDIVVILGAVQNEDTTKELTSSSKNTERENRGKEEPARSVLPFLRVDWSSKADVNKSRGDVENRQSSHGLPTRHIACSALSQSPPQSGNRTNTAVVPPANSTHNNNTDTVRPPATPIPVAESLLRSIYGKASESATEIASWSGNSVAEIPLWNMSQFFPVAMPGTSGNQSLLATSGKKSSDVITAGDLERILLENGFVRQADVAAVLQRASMPTNLQVDTGPQNNRIEGLGQPVGDLLGGTAASTPIPPSRTYPSSQVAFPQPSVLSYKSLKWGVTAASCLTCTILATSILPSLWLMGGLTGSLYGYQTGKRLADGTVPKTFFPSFLLLFGRRIAKSYLQVYDMFSALFFMYKTGQLSYSMWRKYADLDGRFQIQDKIDAWNAVFVEGKENFDRWEKENEVGRKVLATMRTFWLVEERSLKKKGLRRVRKRSRYRVVQVFYDGAYFMGRFAASLWRLISGGGTSQELSEFLRGIRLDISKARLESIGSRIGAIVAALVAVNIAGALYTLSPSFLMFLAIVVSLVWPTWFPELLDRCRLLAEETRARGRGEDEREAPSRRGVDRSRYHYYINRDGRKKYYRVAQSPILQKRVPEEKRFRWPWQKPQEPKRVPLLEFFR